MHIKCLDRTIYGPNGRGWKSHKTPAPAWAEIEFAVRALDQFQHPFIHLWAADDEQSQNYDDSDVLEIMGGLNAYWLAGTMNGFFQRRLHYPEFGTTEIPVWTSDQGFADAEKHICRDIDVVLQITRYYHDNGTFDPSIQWEPNP